MSLSRMKYLTRPVATLLLAGAALLPVATAWAKEADLAKTQTVHLFQPEEGHNGRTPLLQAADGNLYGVTLGGGALMKGTIFRLKPDGSYATLYEFSASDTVGGQPGSGPVEGSDGSLYGTTQLGGANNYGTIYRLDKNGVHTTLHSFLPNNPFQIVSDTWLVMGPDGYLYGTSRIDGQFDKGFIFRIATDGSGYKILHSFTGDAGGREPWAPMVAGPDGALYGTTRFGGTQDCGTIYRIGTGGFSVINSMCGNGEVDPAYPAADLIVDENGVFYGTSEFGGAYGSGTIFRRTVDGKIETMHSFIKKPGVGYNPTARLLRGKGGLLYGVTRFGGESRRGTVFALTLAGKMKFLHLFGTPPKKDGRYPWGPLIQGTDGYLYGMTSGGGRDAFFGTIYRVVPDK